MVRFTHYNPYCGYTIAQGVGSQHSPKKTHSIESIQHQVDANPLSGVSFINAFAAWHLKLGWRFYHSSPFGSMRSFERLSQPGFDRSPFFFRIKKILKRSVVVGGVESVEKIMGSRNHGRSLRFHGCGKPVEKNGASPQDVDRERVFHDPPVVFPVFLPTFFTENPKVFHRDLPQSLKPFLGLGF